jgi:hypothetical protein
MSITRTVRNLSISITAVAMGTVWAWMRQGYVQTTEDKGAPASPGGAPACACEHIRQKPSAEPGARAAAAVARWHGAAIWMPIQAQMWERFRPQPLMGVMVGQTSLCGPGARSF